MSEDKVAAYFASINDKVPLAKWTELKNNQRDRFEEAGISSANDLASRSIDELIKIDGIGPAGAKKWKESAKKYVDLQATDSKWWGWNDALAEVGITVCFLCPEYIKKKYEEKIEGG